MEIQEYEIQKKKKNLHDEFQEGILDTYITLDKNEIHAIYMENAIYLKSIKT